LGNEDILDEDVVGAWLDGYAVIAALVDHVCELDVICIHGVKSVCILNPLLPKQSAFSHLGIFEYFKSELTRNILWLVLRLHYLTLSAKGAAGQNFKKPVLTLVPKGAFAAVALTRISSNQMLVPLIIFIDHSGGSLTKTRIFSDRLAVGTEGRLTVLNEYITDIPKDKWHWTSW
jgi:hypothetical protein